MLILERGSTNPPDKSNEMKSMLAKINDLEAQLQSALERNELLKKELESRKRLKFANKYYANFTKC